MKIFLVFILIYFSIGVYADNLEPIRKLREAGRFEEAIETLMKQNYTWIKMHTKMQFVFIPAFAMC